MIELVSVAVLGFLAGFATPYVINWADWYFHRRARGRPWFDS